MSRDRQPWIFPLSVLIAIMLSVMPLPVGLQPFRPAWLALVLAYWIIETPDKVSMPLAFILGLIEDLVAGSMMGEHALRLVVVTFILMRFRARIRFFPLSQQALVIVAVLINDKIISAVLHAFWREPAASLWSWITPVLAFVLWPLVFMALDSVRLRGWKK